MSVISITIIESSDQIVAGIPRSIGISTNIPSTVFYTLDGSTPTLFSTQYINPVFLPTNAPQVILNILATDGVNYSPIVSETYLTDMVEDARLPHSGTTAQAGSNIPSQFPFGTPFIQPNAQFVNPAEVGITVDNPALTEIASGFDSNGNPVGFTNKSFDLTNYSIKYTTTDAEGQTGPGIGNLPANITVEAEIPAPESTDQNSNMFDPRAFVIFQDASKDNPNDPPIINRMHFSLEDSNKIRDGNNYFNTGLDAPPVSGSFLRSHYNSRTNEITYYYLDTWALKWIISTQPYVQTGTFDGNMSGAIAAGNGNRYVFEWLEFTRRVLF